MCSKRLCEERQESLQTRLWCMTERDRCTRRWLYIGWAKRRDDKLHATHYCYVSVWELLMCMCVVCVGFPCNVFLMFCRCLRKSLLKNVQMILAKICKYFHCESLFKYYECRLLLTRSQFLSIQSSVNPA